MAPIPLLVVLGVAVVGILSHKAIVGPVEVPPLDFGTNSEKGSMFDFIAGRYDAINRVLAFNMDVHWRKVMIKRIKGHLEINAIESPQIIDVATGTADVALMMSEMIPAATIIGVDPSNGMLDVGRKKITKKKKNDQISLEWADARDFSNYEANVFDAGTMAFGIRNVPEREVALCEIYKVLKPGSLFCILEFSEPSGKKSPMGAAAGFFIQKVVPYVGGILSGQRKMYKHLQNSIKNFPAPEDFKAMIDGLQCSAGKPSFYVEEIEDLGMTFGAVQIYAIKSLKVEAVPQPKEVPHQEIPVPPVQEETFDEDVVGEERAEETVEEPVATEESAKATMA